MPQTAAPLSRVIDYLRRVSESTTVNELKDGQLIELFLRERNESAFAALVHRHGPMVFGVCRRFLPRVHDAEDAFQATFLVLARRAASIQARENVGNWLYGVAYRVAIKARAFYWKQQKREKQVAQLPDRERTEPTWDDVKAVVDDELSKLPANFRRVLVLCDLEGHTQQEAGKQLGIPEGTISSRLTRGRKLLAARLTRRGVALSAGGLAVLLLEKPALAGLSYPLVSLTLRGIMSSLSAADGVGCEFSKNVFHLATKVSPSMTKKSILIGFFGVVFLAVVCGLATVLAGMGGGAGSLTGTNSNAPADPAPGTGAAQEPDYTTPIINKAVTALGDPQKQAKYKGISLDVQFKVKENNGESGLSGRFTILGYDKYRADATFMDPSAGNELGVVVVNGNSGWAMNAQKQEEIMDKKLKPYLAMLHAVRFSQKPSALLAKEFKLSHLGELKIGDRDMVGLNVEQEGFRDIGIYFDKQTGLPAKCEFLFPKVPGSMEDMQISLTFSDYKEFDGIKHFTKFAVNVEQQQLTTVELSNIRLLETIDAKQFTKPAS
jgi:RNA polymerase sigma factor (sigma-70 family)